MRTIAKFIVKIIETSPDDRGVVSRLEVKDATAMDVAVLYERVRTLLRKFERQLDGLDAGPPSKEKVEKNRLN